jgi:Tol biopolymer transport system component
MPLKASPKGLTMRITLVFGLLVSLTVAGSAQLSVVGVERLPLARGEWHAQRFSPDGTKLFLTTQSYNGIWEYTIPKKSLRQITSEQGAGYEFSVAPDGQHVAYRREVRQRGRVVRQEVVTRNLQSGAARVVASGKNLSIPQFSRKGVVYAASGKSLVNAPAPDPEDAAVLGIENTKIVLQRNGRKVLLDPLGNGSYIWPSLSPDKTRLLAHDITVGTFICDLDGRILARLGRCNAPAWTRDGRWVVYMDDRDDGHRLLSSEISCVSADGSVRVRLPAAVGKMLMYPQCSPLENKIACTTPEGEIFMISYQEEGQ